jgi:hypothetical protein
MFSGLRNPESSQILENEKDFCASEVLMQRRIGAIPKSPLFDRQNWLSSRIASDRIFDLEWNVCAEYDVRNLSI